jgi:hypothetical protein
LGCSVATVSNNFRFSHRGDWLPNAGRASCGVRRSRVRGRIHYFRSSSIRVGAACWPEGDQPVRREEASEITIAFTTWAVVVCFACPPNLPSVSDLPGDPGDLRSERAELIHHGVDSVLEFEDFFPDIDGGLAREIPFGHGRSDFRPELARAAALQLIGLNYVSGFVHSDLDEYRFPPCDGEIKKSQPEARFRRSSPRRFGYRGVQNLLISPCKVVSVLQHCASILSK